MQYTGFEMLTDRKLLKIDVIDELTDSTMRRATSIVSLLFTFDEIFSFLLY